MKNVMGQTAHAAAMMIALSFSSVSAAWAVPAPANLNLSSSTRTIVAGTLPNFHTATIVVNGKAMSVGQATVLTPAEAVALQQVLNSGRQSLAIGSTGRAVAGSLLIGSQSTYGDLVVPRAVRAIDLMNSSNSTVFGNILNAGALYAVTTNPAFTTLSIDANSVTNLRGALISSVLPSKALPGVVGALSGVSLTISAAKDIVNRGTISSAGNLSLIAGGSINNARGGLLTGVNNVDVESAAGTIINSGLIQSTGGNVSFGTGSSSNDLNFACTFGSVKALTGNINFAVNGTANLKVSGGNYLSDTLNFNLGSGSGVANVNKITGTVNANADTMHLLARTDSLNIGTWDVTNDPIIANTNSIILDNIATNGAPLVVVSGGNISASTNGVSLSTHSDSGPGGNVFLLAGATFSPVPYSQGVINITGGSTKGGSIDFTSNQLGAIDSSSSVGAGGAVQMAAFAGKTVGSGAIMLPASSTINSSASNNSAPGQVTAVAGVMENVGGAPGVQLGNIVASGSNSADINGNAGGSVTIITAQPSLSQANPLVIDPRSGAVIAGSLIGGTISNASVSVNQITTSGGKVCIVSGMGIQVGGGNGTAIDTTAAAGSSLPGGNVSLIANATGKSSFAACVSVFGDIKTTGSAGQSSGSVNILTNGNVSLGNVSTASCLAGSNAGNVTVIAGAPDTDGSITTGTINAGSASGNGGKVVLATDGVLGNILVQQAAGGTAIDTSAPSSGHNGGSVIIAATGSIIIGPGAAINTSADGNGGNVVLISNRQSATGIEAGGIDTSSTGTSSQAGAVYLITQGGRLSIGHLAQAQASGTAPRVLNAQRCDLSTLLPQAYVLALNVGSNGVTLSTTSGLDALSNTDSGAGTSFSPVGSNIEMHESDVVVEVDDDE